MDKEYALVLAGGGTKGAYQVGVWKALKQLNIKVKAITGTSIGSLNAALILQDDLDAMIKLYENIEINDIMSVSNKIDSNKDIFAMSNLKSIAIDYINNKGIENEPLRKTINKYIDIDKIYKSDIDFGLVTYSIKDKVPLQLFKEEIPKDEMVDFLLASSCFPIFKSQKIGKFEFVDGGLYDNTPINMLIKKGYRNIIVVNLDGLGFNKRIVDKNVYLKCISPTEGLGGTFNFNHRKIKNNITLGYLDTMKCFNKLQGNIYYFSFNEFVKMLKEFNLQTIYGLENAAKIYKIKRDKIYKFEEFVQVLIEKHKNAKKEYEKIKKGLLTKDIKQVNNIFNSKLAICLATDIYLDSPMSKKFTYLKNIAQKFTDSVEALLELENYLK